MMFQPIQVLLLLHLTINEEGNAKRVHLSVLMLISTTSKPIFCFFQYYCFRVRKVINKSLIIHDWQIELHYKLLMTEVPFDFFFILLEAGVVDHQNVGLHHLELKESLTKNLLLCVLCKTSWVVDLVATSLQLGRDRPLVHILLLKVLVLLIIKLQRRRLSKLQSRLLRNS